MKTKHKIILAVVVVAVIIFFVLRAKKKTAAAETKTATASGGGGGGGGSAPVTDLVGTPYITPLAAGISPAIAANMGESAAILSASKARTEEMQKGGTDLRILAPQRTIIGAKTSLTPKSQLPSVFTPKPKITNVFTTNPFFQK